MQILKRTGIFRNQVQTIFTLGSFYRYKKIKILFMKNFTLTVTKKGLMALICCTFIMASCSKKTALVPQHNQLAYEQNLNLNEVKPGTELPEINLAETNDKQINTPVAENENVIIAQTPAKAKNKALPAFSKIKDNTVNKIKDKATIKDIKAPVFASAAKGKLKAFLDGYLRIGVILLLIGILVGLIFSRLGYIISVIGVIFIILWLVQQL